MLIAAVRCNHCTRHVASSIRGPRSMSLLQLSAVPPTPEPLPSLTKEQETRLLAAARARQRPRRPPILLHPPVPGLVSKNPRATMEAIWPRRMPPPSEVKKPRPLHAMFEDTPPPVTNSIHREDAHYPPIPTGAHGYAPMDIAARRQFIFSVTTAKILRHTARNLGYQIVPDGFVRVSDIMRDDFYRDMDFKTFAQYCDRDPRDSFEIAMLPDLIGGRLVDIPWVRARSEHTIPYVDHSTHRILNMGKLQVVIYLCNEEEWEHILKHGIFEGHQHCIRMYRSLAGNLYKNRSIPPRTKVVCVTIDADMAANLGVMFFATHDHKLLAVGNRDGFVPPETFKNAILLDVTSTELLNT